jgi:radical SAM protein with 4Fe4S-binding SPASM domain
MLLCQALQIRILFAPGKEVLFPMLHTALLNTQIISVELLAPFDTGLTVDEWDELMLKEPRIRKVLLYGGPADEILINDGDRFGRKMISFQKDIRKDTNEKISRDRFAPNLSSFTEALVFNAGLNRKVTIDKDGEIRNYLSHAVSYGNINTQSLAAVVHTPAFREKWSLSNDKIEHCKDCKYRYACVSNSDILEIDGRYYKKDMCTFNQLENTWGQ